MDSALKMEVFSCGHFNGMTFGVADLLGIVDAFGALGSKHKVFLKLGHNPDQKITDGQPALGWVQSLEVVGDKLVAYVEGIPSVLMSAIRKKLYRTVSIELDMAVKYKDQSYPMVLSAIALLGADTPAVSCLQDLQHYFSQRSDFTAGSKMCFSAIEGNRSTNSTKGESDMELLQRIEELERENSLLKSNTLIFERATHKASIDSKRAQVAELLEKGVRDELITPAQRTKFSKMLRVDDDESLQGIEVADVQALVAGGKLRTFGSNQGKQGEVTEDNRKPDQRISDEIRELLASKQAHDWLSAQQIVFKRSPDLARDYINQNKIKGE